jgi:hypothetical protein
MHATNFLKKQEIQEIATIEEVVMQICHFR